MVASAAAQDTGLPPKVEPCEPAGQFITRAGATTAPRGMPVVPPGAPPVLRVVGRAVRASSDEVRANPRARSAVLRIAARRP